MDGTLLKKLFREMLRIRLIEEKIADLYPEQEMRCPVHLCIGEEAVAVGTCAALEKQDYVFSAHRSHGHYLAKGGNLNTMMAELCGKVTGCAQGKGGSMHLMDQAAGFLASTPIVGSTIPIAVGAAFASVMKKEKNVTVVFFGEAATEEGVFHEAINFAALKKLPVIFVCANNLYSVYSPLSVRQPDNREVADLAKGHGVETFRGDGNDVAQVYEVSHKATARARRGEGPFFLQFTTYRWREHCGPNYDNTIGYRTEEEFLNWKKLCPIKKTREELLSKKLFSQMDLDRMTQEINQEIEQAVQFAKNSPFPNQTQLTDHIYAG